MECAKLLWHVLVLLIVFLFSFESEFDELMTFHMQNVDLLDPVSLIGIDDNSRKSLSGVRVNQSILQLVPNLQVISRLD